MEVGKRSTPRLQSAVLGVWGNPSGSYVGDGQRVAVINEECPSAVPEALASTLRLFDTCDAVEIELDRILALEDRTLEDNQQGFRRIANLDTTSPELRSLILVLYGGDRPTSEQIDHYGGLFDDLCWYTATPEPEPEYSRAMACDDFFDAVEFGIDNDSTETSDLLINAIWNDAFDAGDDDFEFAVDAFLTGQENRDRELFDAASGRISDLCIDAGYSP